MRKKYFGEEHAFRFIWDNADQDGIWKGDAASLAREFACQRAPPSRSSTSFAPDASLRSSIPGRTSSCGGGRRITPTPSDNPEFPPTAVFVYRWATCVVA